MSFITDLRFALRSLARVKGLALTVVVTLALGIGANAAIFSVVRGVLLRPLVNRDQDSLIYLQQSAPGIGVESVKFSIPELRDLQGRVKTLSSFGDFSTIEFTIIGAVEPSVPYPTETEIIANVVTSPHHMDATMVDGRVHRMTDLFGRLAPGVDLDTARAELRAVHRSIVSAHPESYSKQADFRL